ncbi:hypothetical protein C8R45DRAFT_1147521 [Mycena sanguinolenta]|nr:hypothetical protein C8R45DRAFT_1147521 [Mycena sanguinolenta]
MFQPAEILMERFAISAAGGSVDDLNHLLNLVADDDHRYTQCLPVLYANLDPGRIPDEDNLNTDAVKCANFALDSLGKLEYAPESTWPQLWPRIWTWIAFFEAYRECLAFHCDDDLIIKVDIDRTVGWRTLVMQAWSMILESADPVAHYAFPDLCRAIGDMKIDTPEDFEEVLDGAQGAHNLGRVVVESIKLLLVPKRPYISDHGLRFLTLIVLFLECLGRHRTISPALMHNGGATVLTAAAAACHEADRGFERSLVQQKAVLLCLNALSSMLSCHREMRVALSSGLLPSIIYCATVNPDLRLDSEMRGLKQILTRTLLGSTVFQSVLAELDTRLKEVRNTLASPNFQRSWMYDDWLKFTAIADDRIAFMNHVQSKDFTPFKACDNMDDSNVALTVSRCITAAPIARKSIGGLVATETPANQCEFSHPDLGARNMQFMRQLFHRDLMEHRYSQSSPLIPSARLRELRKLARTSQSDPFVTVMDYGFPNEPVLYMEGISWMEDFWSDSQPIYWEEHIARMTRSHGRMELHIMVIPEGLMFPRRWGPPPRHLMFPQRSQRSALHQRVRRLLRAGGSNVKEIDIQQLLFENDSVLKIH